MVEVIGSQISLTPVPATPAPGASVRVEIRVTDSNGAAVPNAEVDLSGTLGLTGSVTTDASGNAVATLRAAPARTGNYTVVAEALGVETVRTVQVVGATDNGIPDATGTISSSQLSIVPNTIAPNVSGSTTNRAVLRAKFLDSQNRAIQNVRVRFEILGAAPGRRREDQHRGCHRLHRRQRRSHRRLHRRHAFEPDRRRAHPRLLRPDRRVHRRRQVHQSEEETLTVAGQPLSVTPGDNNTLIRPDNALTYIKRFDVAVADAAGNAVADAVISASVDIVRYRKGEFAGPTISCLNEDTNRNGSLDRGEDINGTGDIEPRKADIILSFVNTNKTGANGRMVIRSSTRRTSPPAAVRRQGHDQRRRLGRQLHQALRHGLHRRRRRERVVPERSVRQRPDCTSPN
ncbi:carboxypeptidase regulatory-like domain-containing protein [Ramlibacter terrae]|uniref:Carboxypeptidase regulatory-like domain-containing protein n=1 Tax=Ramlibacter terrae TaxID=2732511 RepID=A0ABX6P792_9BURK|nr:carboxypeptidase regulatory-like domain-containing protein [Ramlibacter terrae]